MKSIMLSNFVKNKKALIVFVIIMMIMTVLSCKQNPIFFNISTEVAPNKPKIPGAPSKIVAITESSNAELDNKLYLVRSAVWTYDGNSWEKMTSQPSASGEIVDVAATNDALYVLAVYPYELWKTSDGTNWTNISNNTNYNVQAIHAVDDQLFAAGADWDNETALNQDYAILWYDGTALVSLKENMGSSGRLSGAVHAAGNYYLATIGGIYSLDIPASGALDSVSALTGTTSKGNITGIIADKTETNLLAVSSLKEGAGRILTAPVGAAASFTEKASFNNVRLNGALNIAETDPGTFVLMVGYESERDTYNFGYRELLLGTDGVLPSGYGLNIPGSFSGSTVTYSEKSEAVYKSSLGREIASAIIQTPVDIDANKTLFASTYREGLWSYRNEEWNAEE